MYNSCITYHQYLRVIVHLVKMIIVWSVLRRSRGLFQASLLGNALGLSFMKRTPCCHDDCIGFSWGFCHVMNIPHSLFVWWLWNLSLVVMKYLPSMHRLNSRGSPLPCLVIFSLFYFLFLKAKPGVDKLLMTLKKCHPNILTIVKLVEFHDSLTQRHFIGQNSNGIFSHDISRQHSIHIDV